MKLPFLRRRRPPAAALLEAPRAGIDRVRGALPESGLAEIFADLAAHTGVDLSEVAQRVFDRMGEVAARAEDEAGEFADSDTARQLRDLAARAAGRAAELAYRTGAERLIEALPQRRRRSRRAIFRSAGVGFLVGGVVAYLVISRLSRREFPQEAAGDGGSSGGAGVAVTQAGEQAVAAVTEPVRGFIGGLRQRIHAAGRAARAEQAATERQLWLQYQNRPTPPGDWQALEAPDGPR